MKLYGECVVRGFPSTHTMPLLSLENTNQKYANQDALLRFKSTMLSDIAKEMEISWETAGEMHWQLG